MRKLSLSSEARAAAARAVADDPRLAAFPVQQLVRSRVHAFQLAFANEAVARLGVPGKDVFYEPSYRGLRVLGATEMALAGPARALGNWYGPHVAIRPAQVHYHSGDEVREPVMAVVVRAPRRLAPEVRKDLQRRDAELGEISFHRGACVVRARATQAELLGYPAWLDALTDGTGEVWMRLSHYAPVVRDPGPAAA
ncbi:MAG: hypothetical protein KJ025_04680 [Burkholderiales bacterium]|nr:hypothetical protein [Burkholderiales bacterium]